MNKILLVGEASLNFKAEDKQNILDAHTFVKEVGGEALLAIKIAEKGGKAAILSKIGNDPFGASLRQILNDHDIDTDALYEDHLFPTTISFSSLDENYNIKEKIYLNSGADLNLQEKEVSLIVLENIKLLHLSTYGLLNGNRDCIRHLLLWAKKKKIAVSLSLEESFPYRKKEARDIIFDLIPLTNYLNLNITTISQLTGHLFPSFATQKLFNDFSSLQAILLRDETKIVFYDRDNCSEVSINKNEYISFLASLLISIANKTPEEKIILK